MRVCLSSQGTCFHSLTLTFPLFFSASPCQYWVGPPFINIYITNIWPDAGDKFLRQWQESLQICWLWCQFSFPAHPKDAQLAWDLVTAVAIWAWKSSLSSSMKHLEIIQYQCCFTLQCVSIRRWYTGYKGNGKFPVPSRHRKQSEWMIQGMDHAFMLFTPLEFQRLTCCMFRHCLRQMVVIWLTVACCLLSSHTSLAI